MAGHQWSWRAFIYQSAEEGVWLFSGPVWHKLWRSPVGDFSISTVYHWLIKRDSNHFFLFLNIYWGTVCFSRTHQLPVMSLFFNLIVKGAAHCPTWGSNWQHWCCERCALINWGTGCSNCNQFYTVYNHITRREKDYKFHSADDSACHSTPQVYLLFPWVSLPVVNLQL